MTWIAHSGHPLFLVDDLYVPDPALGPKLNTILEPCDQVPKKHIFTERLWDYLKKHKARHRARGIGFGYNLVGSEEVAATLSARYYKDGDEILIDGGNGRRPLRLTSRECARLMGFDSPDRPPWQIPVSDVQAYKQFGNAVVVQVAEAVAHHMKLGV